MSSRRPPRPRRRERPSRAGSVWRGSHLALIAAVYTAAWWPILLNGGRYWDDWVMVRFSFKGASLMADQIGQLWQRYYWMVLSWMPGAEYLFHGLTFLLFLMAAMLTYGLLRRVPGISPRAALLSALLSGVLPVNAARFAHVNFQYTLSLALFYLAWYLVAEDLDRPSLIRRLGSGLLLVFALITTNSLLVFIFMLPAYILWVRRGDLRDPQVRRQLLARYGFLLVLPFAVFAFRSAALRPWGIYATYNEVSSESLMRGIRFIPGVVRESLLKPVWEPLAEAGWWLALSVPVFLALQRLARGDRRPPKTGVLAAAGSMAFALAVFPYIAVGKLPQATGFGWDLWDSRHQVLVPLGAALLVCWVIELTGRLARSRYALTLGLAAVLIVGFVAADVSTSLGYQADWYKQASLMAHMAESRDFRDGNYFYVEDDAVQLNVMGRRYLPYELSGMMYRVLGDATRFAIDEKLVGTYAAQLDGYRDYEQYHWWDWQAPARSYLVTLTPGTVDVTDDATLLGLMWQERFDHARFEERLLEVLTVETQPYVQPTN